MVVMTVVKTFLIQASKKRIKNLQSECLMFFCQDFGSEAQERSDHCSGHQTAATLHPVGTNEATVSPACCVNGISQGGAALPAACGLSLVPSHILEDKGFGRVDHK